MKFLFVRFMLTVFAVVSIVSASGALISIALKTYGLNNNVSVPWMATLCCVLALEAAVMIVAAISVKPSG